MNEVNYPGKGKEWAVKGDMKCNEKKTEEMKLVNGHKHKMIFHP